MNLTKKEAEKLLNSDNPEVVINTLLLITFNSKDSDWIEEKCLMLLNHKNSDIKGLAATCLGHLARIHKKINTKKVVPILESKLNDTEIGGRVQDALDDISMFVY